jgi:hypothetical protein
MILVSHLDRGYNVTFERLISKETNLYIETLQHYFSDVWMGLNDIKSEGIFLWEYSGATVDLSEVGTSIGYNDNDMDCIYIDASAGAWFADSCERTLKYMCELSL